MSIFTFMEKDYTASDISSVLSMFLPKGLLSYFDIVFYSETEICYLLYWEEMNNIPEELSSLSLRSKGFFPEIQVQNSPIRGKAVFLNIKRRRWEDPSTGKTYSKDCQLFAVGTLISAEKRIT